MSAAPLGGVESPGMESTKASLVLSPDPASAYAARSFVSRTLRRWGRADLVEQAVLLTSEVVTNAILHARTDLVVIVRLADGRLRVTVRDEVIAAPRRREPGPTGGRGLVLLDALARSWGTLPYGAGKAVWFEL